MKKNLLDQLYQSPYHVIPAENEAVLRRKILWKLASVYIPEAGEMPFARGDSRASEDDQAEEN